MVLKSNSFWIRFEFVLNSFWIHFKFVLNSFWIRFESVLNSFWIRFEFVLKPFWNRFKTKLILVCMGLLGHHTTPCMSVCLPRSLFHCSLSCRFHVLQISPSICRGSLQPEDFCTSIRIACVRTSSSRDRFDFSLFRYFLVTLLARFPLCL